MTPTIGYIVYALIFASAVLAVQLMSGAARHAAGRVALVNERLRRLSTDDPHDQVLNKMRTGRGLTASGELQGFAIWLKTLVLHSGLPLGGLRIYGVLFLGMLSLAGFSFLSQGTWMSALVGAISGLTLPILGLKFLSKRRRKKAVSRLPEALDVIVRSLEAGHPIPVAMGLVGREMPDPLGSEFGVASDEVAFGASISGAIQRLADRVGHEDFDLFAAMIRLQERTGGNLAELLRKNSQTIRERQKMRLKIKAASAEGRMSALILNLAPIGLFLLISKGAPDFYGDVSHHPAVKYAAYGVISWMVIGNLVMRKMINFKI